MPAIQRLILEMTNNHLNKKIIADRPAGEKAVRITVSVIAIVAIIAAVVPWYSSYLQNRALVQAEHGWQAESLHTAELAARLNPLSVQGMFILAGAQQRVGREGEAGKTLLEATAMQPQNYATWEQLAIFEKGTLGETAAATEHFAIAVSLNPHDKQLRVRAGLAGVDEADQTGIQTQ